MKVGVGPWAQIGSYGGPTVEGSKSIKWALFFPSYLMCRAHAFESAAPEEDTPVIEFCFIIINIAFKKNYLNSLKINVKTTSHMDDISIKS